MQHAIARSTPMTNWIRDPESSYEAERFPASWEGTQGSLASARLSPPDFVTDDSMVRWFEQAAQRLRSLLARVSMEMRDDSGIPDVFEMPQSPWKGLTLRVVRTEPSGFRFIED